MNMKHITKRDKQLAIVLAFALVLTIAVRVGFDKKATTDTTATESALRAGAVTEFESLQTAGLTAGSISDINDYSNATATVSNEEKTKVTSQLLLDQEYEEGTVYGYKNLGFSEVEGNLNVREEASEDASVVGKLTNHNAVEIKSTSKDGKWLEITSGNVEGYVSAKYILTGDRALALVDDLIATYATVKVDTLKVREKPSTDSNILSKVHDADDLRVISIQTVENKDKDGKTVTEEWVEIEHDDEETEEIETAFVFKNHVELANKFPTGKTIKELHYGSEVDDTRVALCEMALKYYGGRYVWGGSTLGRGVDCSGFTMAIYRQFGIKLEHHAATQATQGRRIKASEAKPGDLFFYKRPGHSGIGHVGIYIGGGQIIHAASSRQGIIISSAYYQTPLAVCSYLD